MSSYPHLTSDEIETLTIFFNWVDQDKDGFVTVFEIKQACAIDLDGNGVITESEKLQCAGPWLASLTSEQDLDNDTRLSLHELLQYNNDSKK